MTEHELQRKIEQENYDITTAARINEFLKDPAIAGFLRSKQEQAFNLFLRADSDEKRRDVWAIANAYESLKVGVNAIQQNGKMASDSRARREADQAARERAKTRR